jgi:hypothetical protein
MFKRLANKLRERDATLVRRASGSLKQSVIGLNHHPLHSASNASREARRANAGSG